MDVDTYAVEAAVEATHWWFVGRRRLFAREIARLRLPSDSCVSDIGTGTGSGLRMLRDVGIGRTLQLAEAMGLGKLPGVPSVALGSGDGPC